MDRVVRGNAHVDGRSHGSWFVGHFVDVEQMNLRKTDQAEVQLRRHPEGNRKEGWARNHKACTLVILIRGRFVVEFQEGEVVLGEEGDYALWPPDLPHSWRAEEETLVVTVRWPSLPGDQQDC